MTTAEGFAPAKINLTLHVTGQRADGYHLLDSLVVFADVGDRLSYDAGPEMGVTVTGPFGPGVPLDRSNLVWTAAEACGWTGNIHLEKNLPHGAGIGGGSSDAAAVLRDLGGSAEKALGLGADVPVCLSHAPQRMAGIGEVLAEVPTAPALDLVLVNPGGHVPTPEVFKALAVKDNPDMGDLPEFAGRESFLTWLGAQRNDLEAPALALAPQINGALTALQGADLVRMSGSGATCFGVFANRAEAEAAAERIAMAHPEWWVVACRSFGGAAGQIPPRHQFKRSTT